MISVAAAKFSIPARLDWSAKTTTVSTSASEGEHGTGVVVSGCKVGLGAATESVS